MEEHADVTDENPAPQEPPQPVDAPPAPPTADEYSPPVAEQQVAAPAAPPEPEEPAAPSPAPRPASEPTVGRLVHYTLSRKDAEHANRRRVTTKSIADRVNAGTWSVGAQAHIGNEVREGQVLPMIVVSVCFPGDDQGRVNGQVFLDGNDQLFVTSRPQGTEPGTWAWPPRS